MLTLRKSFILLVLFLIVVPGLAHEHTLLSSVDPVILTIDGIVAKPQSLTASDLAKLPRRTIETKAPDGTVIKYEGPLLADVLATAGVVFGPDLKGPLLANYVVVTGGDKFRVVFALPELDASFTDRLIILADKRDGQPLSAAEGPLRSIVADEKRQSRWVKQVVTLTVMSAPMPNPNKLINKKAPRAARLARARS